MSSSRDMFMDDSPTVCEATVSADSLLVCERDAMTGS